MLHPPEPVAPPCPSTGHLEARVRPKFPNTGLPATKFGMLRIRRVLGRVLDRVREDSDERVGLGCSRSASQKRWRGARKHLIAIDQQLVYLARIAAHENAARSLTRGDTQLP